MKQLFKLLVGGMLMMAWPLMMSSCEGTLDDIFVEWSRPGSQPTKEEVLDNLSSALEEGAVITITYTLDGVKYTSTMKKQGDEFIELSAAEAATRAMTRGLVIPVCSGIELKNKINFKFYQGKVLKLDVSIMKENCETITNYASSGSEILGAYVNGQQANLKKSSDYSSIEIRSVNRVSVWKTASFDVKKGETWEKFSSRIEDPDNQIHFETTSDAVYFTCIDERDVQKGVLCNDVNISDKTKVLPSDVVGEYQVYYLILYIPVSCKERSWDETNHKVVTSDKTFDKCKVVLSSDESQDWEAGTYVVDHDVTIDGEISFKGDVNLILCDGCTLTLSNEINGRKKSFTIYGQTAGSGKLISTYMGHGLCNFSDFVIHGGNIEVEYATNQVFNLKMYGGKFTASSSTIGPAIKSDVSNNITIYGGELEAVNNGADANAIIVGDETFPGTLTVYGGKVTANAPKGQAIKGNFAKGEGTSVWFFESNDGVWSEPLGEDDHTSTAHYFKAEVVEESAEASGTE